MNDQHGFQLRASLPSRVLWRLGLVTLLGAASCISLWLVRSLIAGNFLYHFLIFNLGLALLPFLFASLAFTATQNQKRLHRYSLLAFLALLWLLFFPNAPYIFTDFIYFARTYFANFSTGLKTGPGALIWYDLLVVVSFSFTGHFIGLASLWIMERSFRLLAGRLLASSVIIIAILLAGFGIYLGRFTRLNSWDILFGPGRVIAEIAAAYTEPTILIFSSAFSIFILLSYGAFSAFLNLSSLLRGSPTSHLKHPQG